MSIRCCSCDKREHRKPISFFDTMLDVAQFRSRGWHVDVKRGKHLCPTCLGNKKFG